MRQALFLALMLSMLAVSPATWGANPMRPAVLELFTSDGCSSCPPAELLITELAQRADVLALSFHVDYWDDLGWRDHYSLALATERQRRYAQTLHRASVYTPQAVVDGVRDLVGSQRDAVMAAVSKPRQGIPIATSVASGAVRINVGAGVVQGVSEVLLVGYLREAISPIGRGENAGRTLKESNTVRAVRSLGPWRGEPRSFEVALEALPKDVTDIAVLVQLAGQGEILGAAAQSIR